MIFIDFFSALTSIYLVFSSLLLVFTVAMATFKYGIGENYLPSVIQAFVVAAGILFAFPILNKDTSMVFTFAMVKINPMTVFGVICLAISAILYQKNKNNKNSNFDDK